MNALQNFAFDDHLVRVVDRDGEPWFVGSDVCKCLGLSNAPQALASLDADEKQPDISISDTSGTKYATIVSEPGVYRLVFRSRKPQAERFKRWLAHDVLPQIRETGRYGPEEHANDAAAEGPASALMAKLSALREARLLFGVERARRLWPLLGLPPVPQADSPLAAEARACLDHLLDLRLADGLPAGDALTLAADGDEQVARALARAGLRVVREDGCEWLCVAARTDALLRHFRDTDWPDGQWSRALRALPGARPARTMKYGDKTSRGTMIPLEVITS